MPVHGSIERVRQSVRRAAARVTLAKVVVVVELLARLAKALAQLSQVVQQHGGGVCP